MQDDLQDLLADIKALGYPIKLDTNGLRPQVLRRIVAAGLVDYVAMDVKNCPARYGETVGIPGLDLAPIEESLRFLLSGAVDYELRTTVSEEFHDEQAVAEMARWVQELVPGKKAKRFFIQPFVDRDSVLCPGLHTVQAEKVRRLREIVAICAENAEIRGNG